MYKMNDTGYEKRRGCGCGTVAALAAVAGGLALLAGGVKELIPPPETAHIETTLSYPGGSAPLVYDRNRERASYAAGSTPSLLIKLVCDKDNNASWSAHAEVFGRPIDKGFTVKSDENTLSPCVKGKVNPNYDKAVQGQFLTLAGQVMRSRIFGLIPFPWK